MSSTRGVLSVECPYCGVAPGERCRIKSPQATFSPAVYGPGQYHAARQRAAEEKEKSK